jgi:hypothetical protein
MAASDLYLYRKDRRWQKCSKVLEVFLSGSQTAYASVTGNATTNVVTITGATLANGMQVTFTNIVGGSGLTANTAYYVIAASGATCQLSLTQGGSAIDFTTNITAGSVIVSNDQMRVWSSEFRDIFQTSATSAVPTSGTGLTFNGSTTLPGIGDPSVESVLVAGAFRGVQNKNNLTLYSDEAAHAPLRQTLLNRTFWIFDRGASVDPRYLYAEYMQGDQILDNPPETE